MLVALLFTTAVTAATIQQPTLDRFKQQAPTVKKWAGWVLVVIGLWYLLLAVFVDFFAGLLPV